MLENTWEKSLTQNVPLLARFEGERARLRSMAQRMLGSVAEAEDVLQDAWVRLQGSDGDAIGDPGAWLSTVVARLAVDLLRARARTQVDAAGPEASMPQAGWKGPADPEQQLVLADSVGIALLVVLDRLRPPERVAFVLHDLFDVRFQDVAAALGCSPDAARQLASRARRSVRGAREDVAASRDTPKRALVEAFFAASRSGDLNALLRLLDADVALVVDPVLTASRRPLTVRGAGTIAKRARLGAAQQLAASVMLVNGEPAIVVAPAGRLHLAMTFVTNGNRITGIEVVADPLRLAAFTTATDDALASGRFVRQQVE